VDSGADPDTDVRPDSQLESVAKIRLNIRGARENATATPLERQQALTNYLTGDPSDWKTGIANFKRVRYNEILPGIDIEYYGRDGRLEYDFVVHPGGDPGSIEFSIEGARKASASTRRMAGYQPGRAADHSARARFWQLADNGQRINIPSS
jgi:hypothetical protein